MSNDTATGARQGRSPAYPYVSLRKALSRAKALYKAEGKHPVPLSSAYKAWGIGAKSSGARQTLAALKQFGLVTYLGKAKERQVRVSDLAMKIILDRRPDSPGRDEMIRRAAMIPLIYTELWQKYGAELPSDATLETYLVLEREFNESAVLGLIADYKDTIELAKLREPDKMPKSDQVEERAFGREGGMPSEPTFGEIFQEGEREFLRSPLSPDCSVRLLVRGPITSKELRKLRHLIYFLELWHDLDESRGGGLTRELEEKLDKASKPTEPN